MKKNSMVKVLFCLTALVMAFSFAACSDDDDDDDDSPSVVAVYTGTLSSVSYTLTAYPDGSWVLTGTTSGVTANVAKGTYELKSGDATDGSLTIKKTHLTAGGDQWTELSSLLQTEETVTIKSGKFTYDGIAFTKQ